MKNLELNVAVINKLIIEIDELIKKSNHLILLDSSQILTDQDLCSLFRISTRTLRRYRKKGEFRFIQLGRSYYYFKTDIYLKILKGLDSKK